jgi:hypothetical protein
MDFALPAHSDKMPANFVASLAVCDCTILGLGRRREKDKVSAAKHFKAATDAGDYLSVMLSADISAALYHPGETLHRCLGNHPRRLVIPMCLSVRWYHRAVELGDVTGMAYLDLCSEKGIGLTSAIQALIFAFRRFRTSASFWGSPLTCQGNVRAKPCVSAYTFRAEEDRCEKRTELALTESLLQVAQLPMLSAE